MGDDERGRAACETSCAAAGVEARWRSTRSSPTGTCVVLVATRTASARWLPDAGANDALVAETDLPDELLASGAHLHVAGYALLAPDRGPPRARRSRERSSAG